MTTTAATSDLTKLRDEITAAVAAAGIRSIAFLPDRLDPPLALVQPGSPYIEPSTTSRPGAQRWKVNHEVVLLVAPGDKRPQTVSLDSLIEDALGALVPFGVVQVGQPYSLQIGTNGPSYFAARIQLTTTR